MATQFLKNRTEIVDVDRANPLPIEVIGEIISRTTDALIAQASASISNGIVLLTDLLVTHTDLLQSTNGEAATVGFAGDYRGISVFLHANNTADETIHYRVYGRATAPDGVPFVDGWSIVKEGSLAMTAATKRARIDIGFNNVQEAHYDQYRIVVGRQASGTLVVYSKVVGVR